MKRLERTLAALALTCLMIPGFGRLGHAQGVQVDQKTCTISGALGAPGVTLTGLPGNVVSDRNGQYSAEVPYGWSGKVTPIKVGYCFAPPSREYTKVQGDCRSEDYIASVLTFTISGSVGVPGVLMEGLPGNPMSNAQGRYVAKMPYGWVGRVVPHKEGYDFQPTRREYASITRDLPDEDYTAAEVMVTITDTLRMGDGQPIPDVRVTAEPGDYSASTDKTGTYTLKVPYGWSGTVSFSKEGYEFNPPAYSYQDLTSNRAADMQTRRWRAEVAAGRPPGIPTYPRRAAASPTDDVLIIPTREVAAAKFTETREDMQVMLNILREKLSEPRMILGTLYDYGDFFGGGRGMEAVYLQGYGAIFVMRVDFPLLPTTEPQGQGEQTPAPPADPVWQRARQKLYQPAYGRRDAGARPGGPGEMDFNQFRSDLIQTLKHAANIRNIEPNEWVILTVIGQSGEGFQGGLYGGMMGGIGGYSGGMGGFSGGGGMMGGMGGGYGGGYSSGGFYSSSSSYSSSSATTGRSTGRRALAASATVLTVQAKKADIDAFARGTSLESIYGQDDHIMGVQGQKPAKSSLTFEQFQQKVKVFTY
jgi:hypothetical protein